MAVRALARVLSWPVALVHALGTGTDARLGWMRWIGVACVAVVALAVIARAAFTPDAPRPLRAGAALSALVVPLAVLVWYQSGPAKHGWARRAGTPISLLAGRRSVRVRPSLRAGCSEGRSRSRRSPFSSALTGTLRQTNRPDGLVDIVIRGRLHGGAGGSVRIDLRGSRKAVACR